MPDVVSHSFDVVVWLADESEESLKAMTLIQLLSKSWKKDEGKYLERLLTANPNFSMDSFIKPHAIPINGC